MTPEEILEKLIEIAWANGWPSWRTDGSSMRVDGPWTDDDPRLTINYRSGSYKPSFAVEEILFDHSFIKALCKAKYGDDFRHWPIYQTLQGNFAATHHHLMFLAISEDRLDYLERTFL